MEKVAENTPDLVQANFEAIAELFPHVVTEALDAEGNFTRAIDFDALRQELSDHVVEGPRERYLLDWPGKRAAMLAANAPTRSTLRPVMEESVGFDSTKNLFIEGDNLEALKILQESYLGKVKLIYIDPPYNTGNDFIYEDDFAESAAEYLERSGQADGSGTRLVANSESNGRFHSDWLSMMYPRLRLARNLLSDDGVLFVSISEVELANLALVCDTIFGAANRIAIIAWQNLDTVKNDARYFSGNHEYILAYARDISCVTIPGFPKGEKQRATYRNRDNDERGDYLLTPLHAKSGTAASVYSYTFANGQEWTPPAGTYPRYSRAKLASLEAEGRIFLDPAGRTVPQKKTYWSEVGDRMRPTTFWSAEGFGSTRQSNAELAKLLGKGVFPNPKPTRLIRAIIDMMGFQDGIVMDFFAGSGTTADAVLQANAETGTSLSFMLVQVNEAIDGAAAADEGPRFRTISELSRERIRRAGEALTHGQLTADALSLDVGFRAFRVDASSFVDVLRSPDDSEQMTLQTMSENIEPGRSGEDLLFQVMLDWGLDLSLPIRVMNVSGLPVFDVDHGGLLACFEASLAPDAVKEIASMKPLRVVFRDSGFTSDAERINVEQIFRELSSDTQLKVI